MTTEWIVYVLLVGGLLACAAVATADILRRAALPTRWVWAAALVATMMFSGFSFARIEPRSDSQVTFTAGTALRPPAPVARKGLLEAIARARTAMEGGAARIIGAAHHTFTVRERLSLLSLWFTSSTLLTGILWLVYRGMDRRRRGWPLALLFDVPVRITPAEGPAVVGITAPEVVVPRWLLARTPEEQRLVVVHEREHIAAYDHLLLLGGLLVAALFPWHPAVWWAVSRLRLAIELDCDARVLQRGVKARPYGSLLIDIAGRCAGHRVGALALADRPSHLERRLLAMKNMTPRFTIVRTGVLASIALLSAAMACEARIPTSSEIAKMDVAAAEKAATFVMVPDTGGSMSYDYVVDDKPMTQAEAGAIPDSRIGSVSIAKPRGAAAGAKGLVSIHTVEYEVAHPEARVARRRMRENQDGGAEGKPTNMYIPYGKDAPLVVVDGVIAEQSVLTKLRSTDIASVEVLKGAAATAAWSHPAAANGVITITTKQVKQ